MDTTIVDIQELLYDRSREMCYSNQVGLAGSLAGGLYACGSPKHNLD